MLITFQKIEVYPLPGCKPSPIVYQVKRAESPFSPLSHPIAPSFNICSEGFEWAVGCSFELGEEVTVEISLKETSCPQCRGSGKIHI